MARFLFAEDEPQILWMCGFVTAFAGHVMDGASEGGEASIRVRALEYDAIISDGSMPGMDGPDFLRNVQALTQDRVPTALKSGHPESSVREWCRHLDVQDSYPKQGRDGYAMTDLLAAGLDRLLQLRLAWLVTLQPDVILPRTSPDHWVDFEALDGLLRLDAQLPYGPEEDETGARVLRAPSPRAAVNALAVTVRDWFSMLEPSGVERLHDVVDLVPEPIRGRGEIDETVRLGDEAIRCVAASAPEPLRTRMLLALCCTRYSWRWPVAPGVNLTVDDPIEAHREDGVFHCETGPALRYRDGWEVYALRGVHVPRHVVMQPETIALEEIRSQENAELRRLYRERFGDARYLRESGAQVVHVDTVAVDALVPRGRHITRALLQDDEQRRFLVASDGSTRRVYHMEVPKDCSTCQEAYGRLSGRPDFRTIVQA